jgi:glycosyltransferase involved in cell wall biosynthesis
METKKKIKILFAINCFNIGGAPSVVLNQMKSINKEEFDPYLMTLYPSKKGNFFDQLNFIEDSKIINFKLKNRSSFDFKTLLKIYRFIRKEKFDVIYTHLFLSNLLVRGLAILARVPVILSFEHSFYYSKKRWMVITDFFLSKFTNKIVTPSQEIAEFTSKQEGININKFEIIANPVTIFEEEKVNIKNLREELGIPEDAFVVFNLGRFSKDKGQVYLIKAAQLILKRFENFYFIIVGHGPLENKLRNEIKERNIEKKCKLIVEPERAKEFLYVGDIFVLPSIREGQPIVALEAMMAGKPIIATFLDGTRSIIENKTNGILVQSRNSEEIAEEIIYLYNNPEIRKKISLEGKKVSEKYSISNNIHKFEFLIKSLIKK